MHIRIIAVGGLKETYLKEGINDHIRKMGDVCTIEVKEVADEPVSEGASEKEIEIGKRRETERIIRQIESGSQVILLDVEGQMYNSPQWRRLLRRVSNSGKIPVCLIIGGSHGVHKQIDCLRPKRVSFSRMTFPHQLMRLIVVEQLAHLFKRN